MKLSKTLNKEFPRIPRPYPNILWSDSVQTLQTCAQVCKASLPVYLLLLCWCLRSGPVPNPTRCFMKPLNLGSGLVAQLCQDGHRHGPSSARGSQDQHGCRTRLEPSVLQLEDLSSNPRTRAALRGSVSSGVGTSWFPSTTCLALPARTADPETLP